MNDGIELIESCKRLYLDEIGEPEPNSLRLILVEAIAGAPYAKTDYNIFELQKIFHEATPIIHEPGCKIFEVCWPSYIAYSVRNESFNKEDDSEVKNGKLFAEYSVSRYLDFVMATTFANESCTGPFKHFGVYCLDHVIDVVSEDEPVIKVSCAEE